MGGISIYIAALLMGLAGSLHCLGMCGPIFVASSGFYSSPKEYVKPVLLHHLGKTITYAFIGLIMGFIGKSASLLWYQNRIMIVCGILLLIMAVGGMFNTGIFKRFNTWVTNKMGYYLKKNSNAAIVLGIVNGFIPCGLVVAAAVAAAATQSILGGVLFMVLFGIGTAPALSLAGFAKWFIPLKRIKNLGLWKQIPMFILGIWLLFKGLGLGIPYLSPDLNSHSAEKNCCRHHNPPK
ncbi:MAG: sulfite exporter TauE/SafE family protein [Bacteroidia bacterium]|nr:sulfite exporter TauE/SafE family protein [Bacteroidia bacterium]